MSRFAKSAVLALGLLCVVARPARGAQRRVLDRVVAVVNEEIVLETELEQWAAQQLKGVEFDTDEGRKQWEANKRKALDSMIEGRLIAQQATELKLAVTPQEVDRSIEEIKKSNNLNDEQLAEALKAQGFTLESYRKSLKRQIVEMRVISTAVRSRVSVSDDEVRAYYLQNERQLAGDKQAHVRQILIALAPDASVEDVARRQTTATQVTTLARQGRSFVELAKAYSDDSVTKAEGGDIGWINKGALVEERLNDVIAGMDPGDVRGPIRGARGFYVLQLVERKQGDLKPYEEVKEQLRRQLYDQQVEKSTQSWMRELKKRSHIDIRL